MAKKIRGLMLAEAYKVLKKAGYRIDSYDEDLRVFDAHGNGEDLTVWFDRAGYVYDAN